MAKTNGRLPEGVRLGKDGRFFWALTRKREDGSTFRKAGSAATAQDAGAKYKAALKDFEQGMEATNAQVTFGEWADYCLESIFPVAPSRLGKGFSPKTITEYERQITTNLKPLIGDIVLTKLTPEHVDAALSKLTGTQNKIKARNVGSKLYALAEARRKVPYGANPFKAVQIAKPRKERHDNGATVETIRTLTAKEEECLLGTSYNHPVYGWVHGVILLGLRLGLRKGEILGLEWRNVDFKNKVVRITQQRQRISKATRERMNIKSDGGLIVVDPKTDSGFRTIPLPPSVLAWLTEERKRNDTPFVIPNTLGNLPREPRKVDNAFGKIVELCKLHESKDEHGTPKAIPTPHDLRHTFCSRMANDFNVPVQVLATIAGHSDVKITLAYYVHADTSGIAKAMANMP